MPRTPLAILVGTIVLMPLSACSRPDAEPPPEAGPQAAEAMTVATGRFVDRGGQQTSGTFAIERVGEDLRLVLLDDFRTDDGPDLHVVLSPTTVGTAANDNAVVDGAEIVGPLTRQTGRQVYDLRDDLELEPFASVMIHCVEFSHLYGAAPLR